MSLRIGSSPRPAAPVAVAAAGAPTAQQMKWANDFVKKHAGGTHGQPGPGKLFPDINAGESGLMGAVLSAKATEGMMEMGKWGGNDALRRGKFDPKKELLLAVVTTDYSEPVVYIAALDRKTGKGRLVGSLELTYVSSDYPEAKFAKAFGNPSEYEATALAERVAKSGKKLDLPGKAG
jgi:hypothetical protein